jgi:trk system potassium uptake protein TrkH
MKLQGRLPGDRRVRVERLTPRRFRIAPERRVRRPLPPAAVFILGFGALIVAGALLLALPVASAAGAWTSPIDALFTATSAVCVTGLVVVDTGTYWSPFGQLVIVGLIQAGGFGIMTASTLLLFVLAGRRTSLRDRVLVQASTGEPDLGSVTTLVRRVAVFAFVAEATGAIALGLAFLGTGVAPGQAAWWGVFHAISAFNNAGFDVMGDFASLTRFAEVPLVLAIVGGLVVAGGLGFAILGDAVGKRSWRRLALETKVVLALTIALLVGGAALIGALEWNNPATLGSLEPADRVSNAIFKSVTARTAGFNSISTGELLVPSLMVVMALMFIGGASGSTAGGIKVNTLGVLLVAIASGFRGRPSAEAFGRRIPHLVVYRAIAVTLFSVAFVVLFAIGLLALTGLPALDVLFETVSAMATVGLSMGITPETSPAGRLLLVAAMFAGRLGPLTLVLALAARVHPVKARPAVELVRIG